MKPSFRRPLLHLEALEERCTPASVTLVNSTLVISNPVVVAGATSVTVLQTAVDAFKVSDNNTGGSISYKSITGIIYTGSNLADTFLLDLGGFAYGGSLTVSTGNGADTVSIIGVAGSSINGNINVSEGLGSATSSDALDLNATIAGKAGISAKGAVVFGGSIQALDGPGTGTINFGNTHGGGTPWTTSVNGNLSLDGYTTINLGGGTTTTVAATVGGTLSVLDASETRAVTIGTNSAFSVHGNFDVSTGTGNDTVTLRAMSVFGSTQFNLGDGNNTFTLGSEVALLATATFNGNFGLSEGNGVNTNHVVEGMTVGGDVNVNIGNGNSTFIDEVGSNPVISGSFDLKAGNGNDTITLFGTVLTTSIAGNMTIDVGNGNDAVTVTGAPSGTLNYTGGSGTDSLTLNGGAGGQVWNVDLNFGIHSDTLTLSFVLGFLLGDNTLSGSITGGGVATNTLNNTGFLLSPALLVTDFP